MDEEQSPAATKIFRDFSVQYICSKQSDYAKNFIQNQNKSWKQWFQILHRKTRCKVLRNSFMTEVSII